MDRAWSLVTVTYGGVISILRDITYDECKRIYEELDPYYGQYFQKGGSFLYNTTSNGSIKTRIVFGPPDWDEKEVNSWEYWPKDREETL